MSHSRTVRSEASKAFQKAVNAPRGRGRRTHWAPELARLDALQVYLWDGAMAGDVKPVGMVLRIIERRCRMLGLNKLDASKTDYRRRSNR